MTPNQPLTAGRNPDRRHVPHRTNRWPGANHDQRLRPGRMCLVGDARLVRTKVWSEAGHVWGTGSFYRRG
jgi:hypothetical protein